MDFKRLHALSMWSQSRPGRFLSWVCLAVAWVALLQVGLIVWAGGDWTHGGIHLRHPMACLLVAAGFLFGWYLLRHGLNQGAREWGRFAGRLVLLSISCVVAFLASEILLRAYLKHLQESQSIDKAETISAKLSSETIQSSHPLAAIVKKSSDPLLVYELRPDIEMKFGHRHVKTNSRGMRASREYREEKATNCVRIVGLGDSGMFGWGVHQGEDCLSRLESNLNARLDGKVYEVLNFGVPGYNSQLEVQMLKNRGLAFHPDIVVVWWCDNDFNYPFFIPQEGQWSRKDISFLYYLFFDRQRLPDAVGRLGDMRQFDRRRIPEVFKSGVDTAGVKAVFIDLMELGRKHGFKVVVMGPMQREAKEIFTAIGIPFFDTRDRVDASKYPKDYAVHFIHPSAGGHRVLAETLEQDLRSRGWL